LGVPWKFIGFCGHPDRDHRNESWQLLSWLERANLKPWLVLRDFNEIVDNSEKVGGIPRIERQMEGFRKVIRDYNLGDLGFKGCKFTWSNKRESGTFVKERLDRGLASPEWCALFPNAVIEIEDSACSDHYSLLLRLD
jgi:hypothetical protein